MSACDICGRDDCSTWQGCAARLRILLDAEAEAHAQLRADIERVTAERDRLKGLLHSEMICAMHYCETHEMAYQRPEGSTAGCPHCEAERLELDAQSWQDQCGEWKARAAEAERERDDARASLAKVRADLDTMIHVHDEVEHERDALRAVVVAARGALHHVIDRGNRAALQAALDGAR